jgi:hypothetical protein
LHAALRLDHGVPPGGTYWKIGSTAGSPETAPNAK